MVAKHSLARTDHCGLAGSTSRSVQRTTSLKFKPKAFSESSRAWVIALSYGSPRHDLSCCRAARWDSICSSARAIVHLYEMQCSLNFGRPSVTRTILAQSQPSGSTSVLACSCKTHRSSITIQVDMSRSSCLLTACEALSRRLFRSSSPTRS